MANVSKIVTRVKPILGLLATASRRGLLGRRAQGAYLTLAALLALAEFQPDTLSVDLSDVAGFCAPYGGNHEEVLP